MKLFNFSELVFGISFLIFLCAKETSSQDVVLSYFNVGKYGEPCDQKEDCAQFSVCSKGRCVCDSGCTPFFGVCMKCPGYRQNCFNQCCGDGLVCVRNYCEIPQNDALTFAISQIALASALIFGVAALITLVWKICFSTVRRGRVAPRPSGFSQDSSNSIQRQINQRLQDRPPSYVDVMQGGATITQPKNLIQDSAVLTTILEPPPQYTPPQFDINLNPPPTTNSSNTVTNDSSRKNQELDNNNVPQQPTADSSVHI